jgi:hypothetical protein
MPEIIRCVNHSGVPIGSLTHSCFIMVLKCIVRVDMDLTVLLVIESISPYFFMATVFKCVAAFLNRLQ